MVAIDRVTAEQAMMLCVLADSREDSLERKRGFIKHKKTRRGTDDVYTRRLLAGCLAEGKEQEARVGALLSSVNQRRAEVAFAFF